MTDWVRGTGERPEQRTIVLRYKTADPKHEDIEELIRNIPFGKQNAVILECIRMAAPAVLSALKGNQPPTPVHAADRKTAAPTVVPLPEKLVVQETKTPTEPKFSSSAQSMFEMDEKPK